MAVGFIFQGVPWTPFGCSASTPTLRGLGVQQTIIFCIFHCWRSIGSGCNFIMMKIATRNAKNSIAINSISKYIPILICP